MRDGLKGIGLRTKHYPEILKGDVTIDWFEIISENFMDSGGRPLQILEKIRSDFQIAMHGVSLNIGSPDPINRDYLKRLKKLSNKIQPRMITDHLCWGGVEGRNWHDLLPVPMTEAMVKHISKKIRQTQDVLERKIALENISTYLRFKDDELTAWEFTKAILEEADCNLLLDVNNVYVNQFNHHEDGTEFIRNIPRGRVVQYHLAGHSDHKDFLFDTHDAAVISPVWKLFQLAVEVHGPQPWIVEWDDQIPSLATVEAESKKAAAIVHYVKEKASESLQAKIL